MTLTADATLTSDQALTLATLDLGNKVLTLGSANTDLTIANVVVIDNATEKIVSDAADVAFNGGLTLATNGVFQVTGSSSTISGTINLAGGTLDVDESTTLSANLTHTASSTIDIASAKTLIYSGTAVNVGAFTLTFSGAGTFSNTNAIILNDASSELQLNGGGTLGVVTVSTAISAAGKGLDVDESSTISTLNLNASVPIDILANKTLTVTNGLSVDTGKTLLLKGTGTLASSVALNAGSLDVDDDFKISGDITHTASSSIDVDTAKTLTYTGAAVNLGAFTLTISGAGAISNSNAFTLNHASSELELNGTGTINAVTASAVSSDANTGLDVNVSLTITTLNLNSGLLIDVADTRTLSISSGMSVDSGEILKLTGTGTLASAIVLNTGSLDVDDSITIAGNITHTGSSNIDVAETKTLTYSGNGVNLGAYTLTITGAGTFFSASPLTLNDAASELRLNGTGTINSVTVSANVISTKGLNINETLMITTLNLGANLFVDIDALKTLSLGTLNISADATLTSNQRIGIGTLNLNDHSLTLGSETTDLSISNAVIIDHPSEKIITGAADVAFTGGLTLATNGVLQITGAGGRISGAIALNGGMLDIGDSTTITDNLTHTASSFINIAAGKTLTYSGSALNIGGNTLTLQGAGTFNNANAIILDNTSSELELNGSGTINVVTVLASIITAAKGLDVNESATITTLNLGGSLVLEIAAGKTLTIGSGFSLDGSETLLLSGTGILASDIVLNGGILNTNGSLSLTGNLTQTSSSTLEIASSQTLNYSGAAFNLGAFTLSVRGAGTFNNNNAVMLNNVSSKLQIDGGVTVGLVKVSTAISDTGKGVAVNESATISTLDLEASLPINLATNKILTIGGVSVDSGETLQFNGTGQLVANMILNGGIMDVNGDLTISGNITHTASSTLDIGAGQTLTYSGSAINVGGNTLTIQGPGNLSNNNALILNNAASTLQLEGSGVIRSVTVSTGITASGKGLDVNESTTITTLNLEASLPVDIAASKTLTVDSGVSLDSGETLKLSGTGMLFSAVVLNAGTLDVTDDISLSGDLTHPASSVLSVASTKTLRYSGSALNIGAYTLTVQGAGTLLNTNAIILDNTSSELQLEGSGTVEKVVVSANVTTAGKGFDVDESVTISSLDLGASLLIDAAASKTLTITNLRLSTDATLTSNQALSMGSLDLADRTLTLGSSTTDLNISNAVIIGSTNEKLVTGAADVTFSGGMTLASTGTLQVSGAAGVISGAIELSGGTLDVDADTTISNAITHTVSSTVNIAENSTLTYAGAAINIGANTLTFEGNGSFSNSNAVVLDTADSILNLTGNGTLSKVAVAFAINDNKGLQVTGSPTISALNMNATLVTNISSGKTLSVTENIDIGSGTSLKLPGAGTLAAPLNLSGGVLEVGANITFPRDITHTASSTISISNGKTLTYTGSSINLGAFTLTLSGNANLANTNPVNLNHANSLLILNGNGTLNLLMFSAASNVSKGIKVNASHTISTLTLNGSGLIDIAPAQTLTVSNGITLGSSTALQMLGTGTLASNITLNGGTFEVRESFIFAGVITHTASSVISIASGVIFTYSAGSINLGAYTLTLQGGGVFNNAYALILDHGDSLLKIDGGVTINKVTVSNASNTSKGLVVNASATITTLTLSESTFINIASGVTLGISNELSIPNAKTLVLSNTGTLDPNGNLSIQGTLNPGNGIVDLRGITLTLGSDLNATGATILTDASTLLTLTSNVTLTTDQALTILTLNLEGKALTLGSAASDMTVSDPVEIMTSNQIVTGSATITMTTGISIKPGGSLNVSDIGGGLVGNIILDGGLLEINANLEILDNIELRASSTISVASGVTLTYSGNTIELGEYTLTLEGGGEILNEEESNESIIELNHESSVLAVTDSMGIRVLALTESSNIDIASGKTLSIGMLFTIPENKTLSLTGTGTLDLKGGLTLSGNIDPGSGGLSLRSVSSLGNDLNMSGAELLTDSKPSFILTKSILITADQALSLSSLDLNDKTLTLGSETTDLSILNAVTLGNTSEKIVTGEADVMFEGGAAIEENGTLQITGDGGIISGHIELAGGLLDIDANTTISANLTHTVASSIDVMSDKTALYTGEPLNLGALTLTLRGDGTLENSATEAFVLDHVDGLLRLNGNGTLGSVTVSAMSREGKGLEINSSPTVQNLTLVESCPIKVVASQVLQITDALTIPDSKTLTLSGPGTLKLNSDFTLRGSLIAGNGTLDLGGINMSLSHSLDLSGATLITDAFTNLSLLSSISLITDQPLAIATLTLNDETLTLGSPSTDLTLENSLTLDHADEKIITRGANINFSGGLVLQADGVLQMTAAGSVISGTIDLQGGSIDVDENVTISANMIHSLSSTLDVASGKILQSTGASLGIGGNTLSLLVAGEFQNSNPVILDHADSLLSVNQSGTINSVKVSVSSNLTKGLEINTSATINTLTLEEGTFIDMGDASILSVTNEITVLAEQALKLSGSGTLDLNGGATIKGNLYPTGMVTLDLSGSLLTLENSLDMSGAKLTTDSNTELILNKNVTLTTDEVVSLKTINLNDYSLTLGSAATDLTITNQVTFDKEGEMIVTGGADVTFIGGLRLLPDGVLELSGANGFIYGLVILEGGWIHVTGDSGINANVTLVADSLIKFEEDKILDYEGDSLSLNSQTLTLQGAGNFNNTKALMLNEAQSLLVLNGVSEVKAITVSAAVDENRGIKIDVSSTIETLTLNANLSLNIIESQKVIITGLLAIPQDKSLTLVNPGSLEPLGGLNLSGQIIPEKGILDVRQTTISLANHLNMAGATLLTDEANTTLNLLANATLTSDQLVALKTLELGDKTLTLGSPNTDLKVVDAVTLEGGGSLDTGAADSTFSGGVILKSGGTIVVSGNGGLLSGSVLLAGGILEVKGNTEILANLTLTENAESELRVAEGKTLTYSGNAITMGISTLNLNLSGYFKNSQNIELNHTDSLLKITSAGNEGSGVQRINLSANRNSLEISGRVKITGLLTLPASTTLALSGNGTLDVDGGLQIDGKLENDSILLDVQAAPLVLNTDFKYTPGTLRSDDKTNLRINKDLEFGADVPSSIPDEEHTFQSLTLKGYTLTLVPKNNYTIVDAITFVDQITLDNSYINAGSSTLTLNNPPDRLNNISHSSTGGVIIEIPSNQQFRV
ncbi:hypothetical protein WDW89_25955 [Deltaproteobacteria bacterium TL4]